METTSMPIEILSTPIIQLITLLLLIVLVNLFCANVIIDKVNSGLDHESTQATVLFILWTIHEFTSSAFILIMTSYAFFFIYISLSLIFFLVPIVVFFLRNRKSKRSNDR